MKIFTCTGPVDLDMDVVETDHHMCDNCKGKVINAMQERIEESRPFIKHRDRKDQIGRDRRCVFQIACFGMTFCCKYK